MNMTPGPARPTTQEMSIADFVDLLWRGKRTALLVMGVTLSVGIVLSYLTPAQYQTRALLQLATREGQPIVSSENIIAVFETDAMVREIAESLHSSEQEARDRFTIASKGGKSFVEIRGRGTSPDDAKRTVELVSGMVLERLRTEYQPARDFLEKEIATITEERDSVKNKMARLETTEKNLNADVNTYRAKLKQYSGATSEAETRLVDTYTRLMSDARGQLESIVQQLADAKRRYAFLDEEIERKRIDPVYSLQPPEVEVAAVLPGSSRFIPPHLIPNIIYSGVLGAFLAVTWILVREFHFMRPRREARSRQVGGDVVGV
ncbi:hypothetical protein HYV74_03605 [Candidatus Uhrbacteria bacterium]|nr:hypothetical protein [Candidatus Uhrbacteria bacterium]